VIFFALVNAADLFKHNTQIALDGFSTKKMRMRMKMKMQKHKQKKKMKMKMKMKTKTMKSS
jgi:hypothetical protein